MPAPTVSFLEMLLADDELTQGENVACPPVTQID
jgi:hypothetical protein